MLFARILHSPLSLHMRHEEGEAVGSGSTYALPRMCNVPRKQWGRNPSCMLGARAPPKLTEKQQSSSVPPASCPGGGWGEELPVAGSVLQPTAVSQHVLNSVTPFIWFSLSQPPSILPAATNFGCIKQKQKSRDPV